MSNQNQNPIRVADLSESVYVPRMPAAPTTKGSAEAVTIRRPNLLQEHESQYVWNRQPDDLDKSKRPDAELSVAADAMNGYATPDSNLQGKEHQDLAEIRAQFAYESEQSIAELLPVVVEELHPKNEVSFVGEFFEQMLASPSILEPPKTTRVWGLDYHAVNMEQTLDYLEHIISMRQPSYAVTANLNYAMLCVKNPQLAAFTKKAALTLCDGMPVLWRSKLNSVKLQERVAGADLIYRLTERCAIKKRRVYFYGGSDGIAERTAKRLKELYPKLVVAGVQCPPFRACSSEEVKCQIARIKQAKPDLLLVALGQPKGEYWIEDHLEELGVPLAIQLGASFDFVAGNATRAPMLMQRMGLEWLHRTIKDPTRLAPRYFDNLVFLVKAIRRELIEKLS